MAGGLNEIIANVVNFTHNMYIMEILIETVSAVEIFTSSMITITKNTAAIKKNTELLEKITMDLKKCEININERYCNSSEN